MKRNKIALNFLVAGLLFLIGCKAKFVGLDPSVEIYKVPAVTSHLDATGSPNIQLSDLNGFSGKVVLALYFKDQPAPEKIDLVVRKNLAGGAAVKLVQAGITSFPTTVTVTAEQIRSLFGEDLKAGDNYDFAADVYTSDGKFEAFPANGPGTANSVANGPLYSAFARFTVR
jgi:hypothetical protein